MKLGIAMNLSHNSPEEWAAKHQELGLSSVVFPCGHFDEISKIDSYALDASRCIRGLFAND